MGQKEVIEILEKEDCWMTTKEIAAKLNQNPALVSNSLRKLYEFKEVLRKDALMKGRSTKYQWRAK